MPSKGLSLVGFMSQIQAIDHLRNACIPAIDDDATLIADWQSAKALLGAPTPNAGNPNLTPLPQTHAGWDAALRSGIFAQRLAQPDFHGAQLMMVEIAPLLAFQFSVDTGRSQHHSQTFSSPPTIDEMLPICLPLSLQSENFRVQSAQNSLLITSKSLNLRTQMQGWFQPEFAGITFGISLPFVQVVRYNNRCYLYNGFHRTFGIAAAGGTHVPCIFRDVLDPQAVGLQPNGSFDIPLLESNDPPTVGHYIGGRAFPVTLRATSRVISVNWSEYAVFTE